MEYINIGDIKESATIGIAGSRGIDWADDTISAPPAEIIWDESFIGGGGGDISLFSFNSNWSLRDLFSSIKFDRAEYKASISQLVISCVASIPFSIHFIVYSFELWSSFARSNSSLRDSISDELIWGGFPPVTSKS
ncbi:hypothetical protein RhiirA1_476303 [Rhizophagus irregularis]|uniref:Uncharacterized protein n=1 Tax=Rhizophagus irregularis TaxID=588596 RepID=A0A2N0QVH8_9GLOM|nr:hypothetical protein RhiirA1_476308 [Rhizophagus irregularis]PKC55020.1 hypothetical protein RhiirA1_476303 [Rhizophagus irregularis]